MSGNPPSWSPRAPAAKGGGGKSRGSPEGVRENRDEVGREKAKHRQQGDKARRRRPPPPRRSRSAISSGCGEGFRVGVRPKCVALCPLAGTNGGPATQRQSEMANYYDRLHPSHRRPPCIPPHKGEGGAG